MMMLASTAMPMVNTRPAMPGKVSDASKAARMAIMNSMFSTIATFAMRPGQPVVDEHEQHDGDGADDIENLALSIASSTQGRADLGLEGLAAAARAARPSAAPPPGPWPPAAAATGSPKPPSVMRPRSLICAWMTGALMILSSSTMAMRRPTFSPVRLLDEVAALAVHRESDLGAARLLVPGLRRRWPGTRRSRRRGGSGGRRASLSGVSVAALAAGLLISS